MSSASPTLVHHFSPGTAAGAPVLLLLHGTGGNEHDLLNLGQTLYPGAAMLSPRGRELENGMPRFFRRLAEGVFDEENLIQRTHELADFVAEAAGKYEFDPGKVVAVGYSNGANIAASLLLLRPGVLRGAVLFRAMTPLAPAEAPNLSGTTVFLASGKHDPLVPPLNVEALAAMLENAGAQVAQEWSEVGHQLTSPEIEKARQWLANHF